MGEQDRAGLTQRAFPIGAACCAPRLPGRCPRRLVSRRSRTATRGARVPRRPGRSSPQSCGRELGTVVPTGLDSGPPPAQGVWSRQRRQKSVVPSPPAGGSQMWLHRHWRCQRVSRRASWIWRSAARRHSICREVARKASFWQKTQPSQPDPTHVGEQRPLVGDVMWTAIFTSCGLRADTPGRTPWARRRLGPAPPALLLRLALLSGWARCLLPRARQGGGKSC
jgi:hypothetical protein